VDPYRLAPPRKGPPPLPPEGPLLATRETLPARGKGGIGPGRIPVRRPQLAALGLHPKVDVALRRVFVGLRELSLVHGCDGGEVLGVVPVPRSPPPRAPVLLSYLVKIKMLTVEQRGAGGQ
jgi:hypothetical protein